MTRPSRRLALLFLLCVAAGCHRCGDRPRLFSRLRDREPDDTAPRTTGTTAAPIRDVRRDPADPNCDCLPPPRGTGGGYGQPLSNGTGRFVSPLSGMPYSDPMPAGGFPPSMGGVPYGTPGVPYGQPYRIGAPREDELPPGSLIPSPGVPERANPRATDSRLFPPIGGSGIVTGDPRK